MKNQIVILMILSNFLILSSCTKKQNDENLMVLYRTHPDDIKTLDPANAYDTISLDILPSIYETLYQYDYLSETYRVIPLLAADMPTYSADRLTVKIPIRRGVKFHDDPAFKETKVFRTENLDGLAARSGSGYFEDMRSEKTSPPEEGQEQEVLVGGQKSKGVGRELNAHDFVFAFKRLALPSLESQGFWIFDGKITGFNAFHQKLLNAPKAEVSKIFMDTIEGIKALDDFTLQLKLLKPYPQLLNILCMGFTSPVSHEAITAYADERGNLSDHPLGTGPFLLKTWNRGHRVVLVRNPNYHPEFYPMQGGSKFQKDGLLEDKGKLLPFLDKIVITVVKEDQPAWLGFMKGEFDLMGIPKDNFRQAIVNNIQLSPELSKKGIRLSIDAGVSFYYISFNMKDKLIGGNKFLRQAISSAINREKWIEIFLNGRGSKMVNALPPGTPDRPENSKLKFDFDLQAARDLLKKTGFPEGKGLPVINFDMRGSDSVNRQMGDFFSQQLGAIGINLNVIYNTFPAYLEKAKKGNLQVSMGGWMMDYPDAENNYQLLYGSNKAPGPNESNFDHPEMNKLYEQIAILEPSSKRKALIQKIEDLIQEECPWAYGYYPTDYRLTHGWLLNYRPNEIILSKYKYLKINKEMKNKLMKNF